MRKLFGVLILFLFPVFLRAQCTGSSPTWTSTPDQASLQSCVNGASAGDTINVTAGGGSVTWSKSGVQLNGKPLSIVGPGAASLTINDAIPSNASGTCSIFESVANTTVGSLTRFSGFTLQPAPGTSTVCPAIVMQGACSSSGCPKIRVDHITFSGWASVTRSNNGYGINALADVFGVFDHDIINGVAGSYLQLVEVSHASYQGVGQYGDNSWAQPEFYGSANFLFFENNTFNTSMCCENEAGVGYANVGGTRVVVRFNTFNNMDSLNQALYWHGTESLQRRRGGRAFEFYANTYTCAAGAACNSPATVRSGTGMDWGNSAFATGSLTGLFNFSTYRTEGASAGWGTCDGSSPYDTNDTNGGSGNTAYVYWSGTISSVSVSGNNQTVTVSGGPNWSPNQWSPTGAPYSMHDVTQNKGNEILSNGSNTLAMLNTGVPGSWTPAAGDSIQILRAFACLDSGGGRGAGILYSNPDPAMPSSPANQAFSPTYFWANPFSGGTLSTSSKGGITLWPPNGRVIRNRDYYVENTNQGAQTTPTSPFDGTTGTTGIGHGTLANRPPTCTAGTAYWAEDQGSWNTNGTAIPGISGYTQGVLFVCSSSGTWPSSPTYVPYTYPHPLIAGGGTSTAGDPPNPPTGLAATVQ